MYSLSNYVDAVSEMLRETKSPQIRKKIIESWIALLRRHHRVKEGKKIGEIIEGKIENQKRKAWVLVSNEEDEKSFQKFFAKKNIEVQIDQEKEILAGAKIIWKNLLIDNSFRHQIGKMKKRLNLN